MNMRPDLVFFVPKTRPAPRFGAYRSFMNAQMNIAGVEAPLLGLNSVLVPSLPATLMTNEAPDRYTVEAVFTRKADRDEIIAIQNSETRARLTAHGYSTVELHVSDRRLEIANTNLIELRDGLADVIADTLADISASIRVTREIATHRSEEALSQEVARATAVTALAESISFTADSRRAAPDDGSRLTDWVDEGGAIRI